MVLSKQQHMQIILNAAIQSFEGTYWYNDVSLAVTSKVLMDVEVYV